MAAIVALLRAVNVGGHNKIKMDELRALFKALCLRGVETYVQSGNVVFGTRERDLALLTKRIRGGIERRFALRPEIILRSASELSEVVRRDPFAARKDIDPARLHVVFLADSPRPDACKELLEIKTDHEEVKVGRRELYIYYPHGAGKSKLTLALIEKTLGVFGTARNWNTSNKLLEMAKRLETSEQTGAK